MIFLELVPSTGQEYIDAITERLGSPTEFQLHAGMVGMLDTEGTNDVMRQNDHFELTGSKTVRKLIVVRDMQDDAGRYYREVRLTPVSVFRDSDGAVWHTDGVFAVSYTRYVEKLVYLTLSAIQCLENKAIEDVFTAPKGALFVDAHGYQWCRSDFGIYCFEVVDKRDRSIIQVHKERGPLRRIERGRDNVRLR